GAWGIFTLTNIFVFQPYDYDNTKFLVFAHFITCLVIVTLCFSWWKKNAAGKILVTACVLLLIITGSLSTLRETYISWQLASNSDMEIAEVIKQHTSPDSVFLTADSHNHPVSMLAGRSIVMGYRGWLWTHGINYTNTESDVMSMFAGTQGTVALLREYHISYV